MFKTYEFIFAGMPSSMYGLMVYDFSGNSHSDNPFGNKAEIIETRIPGRVRPLHYGVNYNEEPLSFKLVFGSEKPLDRWDLQGISQWLTGYQQYQWLQIEQPDMTYMSFRCLIKKLTPITVGWYPHAFEAEVICDCPYAYGEEFTETINFSNGMSYYLFSDSSAKDPCKPTMNIITTSGTTFAITNQSDNNRVFKIDGLPSSGAQIYVDNENCIIEDKNNTQRDYYAGFNDNFFRIIPGDNYLQFTGSGTITITGRYYYNVGA